MKTIYFFKSCQAVEHHFIFFHWILTYQAKITFFKKSYIYLLEEYNYIIQIGQLAVALEYQEPT